MEGVERNWSPLNRLRRALQEMGPGAWKDTLDDHIGDANWRRVKHMSTAHMQVESYLKFCLGRALVTKLRTAIAQRLSHQQFFDDFESMVDPAKISEWKMEVESWEEDPGKFSKDKQSPYHSKEKGRLVLSHSQI